MKLQKKTVLSALATLATSGLFGLACSDESTAPGPGGPAGATSTGGSLGAGTGGTTGGTATSATGGTKASTGGASVSTGGSAPTGGASSGGSGGGQAGAGRGGGGAGGSMNGGGAGKSGGTAGISGGGAGGSVGGNAGAGGKGAGGTSGSTKASAGCSKGTARPANGSVSTSSYYLTFPESYDGKAPVPVLIGFHGCGSGNRGTGIESTEYVRQTRGTPFETEYVVAVPISESTGGCWTYSNDMPRIKAMYDDMVTNYCVDQNHVFATGHSSGANLIGEILNTSHTSDAQYIGFKGVAPVAGSQQNIAAPIAVMYIQGTMDSERQNSDGANVVQRFTTANMCMSTYTTYSEVMGCKSKFDQADVDPGCRLYDGCAAKTVWCRHNDKDYSGTMHGIPCFAMKSMHDFFQTLP